MNVQWYPGHMTKAKRMMQEDIKLIDLIVELVDARVPLSSRNPDIDELGKNKSRLILLNKSDLADEKGNSQWEAYFKAQGFHVHNDQCALGSRSESGEWADSGGVQREDRERPAQRNQKPSSSCHGSGNPQQLENLLLSIRLQEKRVLRPETSRA